MSQPELSVLVDAVDAHGILPVATRNFRRIAKSDGARAIVADLAAEEILDGMLVELDQRLIAILGRSLLLASYESRISRVLAKDALAATVVKGPVFARRLYETYSDRSFTDIDILVDPVALEPMGEVLRGFGFHRLAGAPNRPGAQNEFKWHIPGNELVLVEVQTDLVHSAQPNGGIHLRYDDLLMAGDGDAEDATALLLVGAVHGVAGHQFERLQPAVDVLRAVGGNGGKIDAGRLAKAAAATAATAALQTALDVVGILFREGRCADLVSLLPPAPWRRLRAKLLSPAVVLRSQAANGARDSWRRKGIRKLI